MPAVQIDQPADDGYLRCENLQCDLKIRTLDEVVLEPPYNSVHVTWVVKNKMYERDVFLCCDCTQLALSPKGFTVTII
jgi:hypothetical protein